jgi:hypothetical protein
MARNAIVLLIVSGALLMSAIGVSIGGFAAECSVANCGAGQAMQFRQGPYFYHALPAGWEVVEESNSALALRSRDRSADIIVSGIGGLNQPLSPEVFAYQRMTTSLHLTDVRFLSLLYISPMSAYDSAAIMDVTYAAPIGRLRGLVISNVANFYNRNVYNKTDGVMTIVGAKERIWDAYADWLPLVAMQAVNNGPAPFGKTVVSTPVQRDIQQLNQAAAAHRDWSIRTWDEVAQYRAKAQADQSAAPGSMPAGKQWYDNPYGGPPIQQSASPAVIWINRNEQQLPSDNPNFDPRTPADPDWQRLTPKKP